MPNAGTDPQCDTLVSFLFHSILFFRLINESMFEPQFRISAILYSDDGHMSSLRCVIEHSLISSEFVVIHKIIIIIVYAHCLFERTISNFYLYIFPCTIVPE